MVKCKVKATPMEARPWYFAGGLPFDKQATELEIVESPVPYKPESNPKIVDGAVAGEWERPKAIDWASLHELYRDPRISVTVYGEAAERAELRAELAWNQREQRRKVAEIVAHLEAQTGQVVNPDKLPAATEFHVRREMTRIAAREAELLTALGLPPSHAVLHGRFEGNDPAPQQQVKKGN